MDYNFIIILVLNLPLTMQYVNLFSLLKRITGKSTAEYKVYPIILIKTNNGFRLPEDLDYSQKSGFIDGDKRKFKTFKNEKEEVFCSTVKKSSVGKKRKRDDADGSVQSHRLNYEISNVCIVKKSKSQNIITMSNKNYPQCNTESEPVIWRKFNEDENDFEKRIFQYSFGYKICINDTETYKLEIYNFYYDNGAQEVLFTTHKFNSRALLFNKQLEEERNVVYEDGTYGYDFFGEMFSIQKDLFDKISENSEYKIQKLIPCEDFPFALWRKTTYHYLNSNLMHEKLQELWITIANTIRMATQFDDGMLRIYTGAFRIRIPKKYRDIMPEIRTSYGYQIPQMWVKFLHHTRKKSIVGQSDEHTASVIIANNYLDENLRVFIGFQYCRDDYCKNFGKDKYPEDIYKHVRCCSVSDNILKLFNLDNIFTGLYEIGGLIKE